MIKSASALLRREGIVFDILTCCLAYKLQIILQAIYEKLYKNTGLLYSSLPVPEFIDPVFAKTSPKRSICVTENERFGLVFEKTGSINSGTG
jgi:hypothetical protein